MLESMTGYGNAECVQSGVRVVAEIRSVNNRFAEISVKLPRQFSAYEIDARELVRSHFQRGKISVFIQVILDEEVDLALSVNVGKTRAYRQLLDTVREAAGIDAPVTLDHLLRFSEIFDTDNRLLDETEHIWKIIVKVLQEAIDATRTMRRREGAELAGDFASRIALINELLEEIRQLSLQNIDAVRQRITEKVAAVADRDIAYSRDRLEMELVIMSDKLDITEECIRFASHNKFFLEELHNDAQGSGRKLNFLLQEQLREANTIASKSQNADISQRGVHIKEELEKIREQLQNIE
ncbi:YicC/YloC family endoribonuclease [Prosthecochloris sp.]|uniref:YicC/YloC family endoribonuclease n=1 Tax=Prosthecochloris sp. TaxID=290513 RepID=UPI00257C5F4A|nr:YicC/YloC family endoribonuclease [Prosthecochloris sp.]